MFTMKAVCLSVFPLSQIAYERPVPLVFFLLAEPTPFPCLETNKGYDGCQQAPYDDCNEHLQTAFSQGGDFIVL